MHPKKILRLFVYLIGCIAAGFVIQEVADSIFKVNKGKTCAVISIYKNKGNSRRFHTINAFLVSLISCDK